MITKLRNLQKLTFNNKTLFNQISFQIAVGSNNTLYHFLQVSHTSNQEEIKKQYYKLAKEMHPDINQGQTLESFQQLQQVYEILKDPSKREFYDNNFRDVQFRNFGEFQQEYEFQYKNKDKFQQSQAQNQQDYSTRYQNAYNQEQAKYRYTSSYYDDEKRYNRARYQKEYHDFYHKQEKYNQKKRRQKKTQGLFELLKIKYFLGIVALFTLDWLWDYYNEEELEKQILKDMSAEKAVREAAIRRNNVIMSQEDISDSVHVQEKRKKSFEQERKEKQFSIVMEQVPTKKQVKKHQQEVKRQKSEGMESLEGMEKSVKIKIKKSTGGPLKGSDYNLRPKVVKLNVDQYSALADDEYM